VELFTGAFQVLGAVSTVAQAQADYPELEFAMPGPGWPSFSYAPRRFAEGDEPEAGLLAVHITGVTGGDAVPEAELVLRNRDGDSLLVYLPELTGLDADGVRLFVADDGSTHLAPADDDLLAAILTARNLAGLPTARSTVGQVLPIPARRPIQHRRAVAAWLCAAECEPRLRRGELGIDPQRGTFAFAEGDPAIGAPQLTVDYVEAFGGRIGARTFDHGRRAELPTRVVTQLGDAPAVARDHVYTGLQDALDALGDDGGSTEVVEIADSATYALDQPLLVDRLANGRVSIQAADGERPCIVLREPAPTSPPASPPAPVPGPAVVRSTVPLERLELSGLLLSGGVQVDRAVDAALISACTLDPRDGVRPSIVVMDDDRNSASTYLVCRTISGALTFGDGVERLTIADSIVDRFGGLAIAGPMAAPPPTLPATSPPVLRPASPPRPSDVPGLGLRPAGGAAALGLERVIAGTPLRAGAVLDPTTVRAETPVRNLHLERVTVLGRIRCETLEASECLLDDVTEVEDQQAGCIRFSRYELGSTLPRRYQCVPSDAQARAWTGAARCEAPLFGSRTFGWPNYLQLAARTPDSIRNASERRSEVGAFADRLNTLRERGFEIKTREFLPVGLTALALAET
jgi:hypothetical protein